MTRRDFILISETLAAAEPMERAAVSPAHYEGARRQWYATIEFMATALATTCPRFDRARFLKSCGMEG